MSSNTAATERGQMFEWKPSPEIVKTALGFAFAGAGLLGAVGFGESFGSLMGVAEPYLGWASWVLPVVVDLGILVMTVLGLVLAMAGMPSRSISLVPVALSAFTLYLNTTDQHTWTGKAVHGGGPAMWILVVWAGEYAVRRLVGLSGVAKPERIRWILWLIRPVSTLRLWREMRIHQIATYRAALDRDATRTAVVGQLRLRHGRRWKHSAPLAERVGLRLLGRDPAGVRVSLDQHAETVSLLARPALGAAPEPAAPVLAPAAAPVVDLAALMAAEPEPQTSAVVDSRVDTELETVDPRPALAAAPVTTRAPLFIAPSVPTTAEAAELIRAAWADGRGVTETANAVKRDKAQISRTFRRLERDATRHALTLVNGSSAA